VNGTRLGGLSREEPDRRVAPNGVKGRELGGCEREVSPVSLVPADDERTSASRRGVSARPR